MEKKYYSVIVAAALPCCSSRKRLFAQYPVLICYILSCRVQFFLCKFDHHSIILLQQVYDLAYQMFRYHSTQVKSILSAICLTNCSHSSLVSCSFFLRLISLRISSSSKVCNSQCFDIWRFRLSDRILRKQTLHSTCLCRSADCGFPCRLEASPILNIAVTFFHHIGTHNTFLVNSWDWKNVLVFIEITMSIYGSKQ